MTDELLKSLDEDRFDLVIVSGLTVSSQEES
jgi:hypothetical protein